MPPSTEGTPPPELRATPRIEQRLVEVEAENERLAYLYLALTHLHSSLLAREVVNVIVEILLNFVGADSLALFLLDEERALRPIATHGLGADSLPRFRAGDGVIGRVLSSGEPYFADGVTDDAGAQRGPADAPLIAVPLFAVGETIGVLVVWSFFRHKPELGVVDREIFQLLSQTGGTAIEAARLAETTRKLPGGSPAGYYEAVLALLA
jgi:transcriptional regulator with GAF, ATPase, and Fis domain